MRLGAVLGTSARPARLRLLLGSGVLMASAAILAVASFGFWLLAARTYSQVTVGVAAGLASSQLFIVYATNMGLSVAVSRYAAGASDDDRMRFALAGTYALIAGVVGAAVFVAAFGLVSEATDLSNSLPGFLIFSAAVVGGSLAILVDVRLLGLHLRRWILVRASTVGVAKLLLLVVLGSVDSGDMEFWLFVGAVGVDALSGFVGAAVLGRRGVWLLMRGRRPANLRAAFRFAGVNYITLLAWRAPLMLVPIVVLLQVPAATNAAFYIMWSVTLVTIVAPRGVMSTLLVEAGRDGAGPRSQARFALRVSLGLSTAAFLLAFPLGQLMARIYGSGYAEIARLLPILLAALIPWSVTAIMLTMAQVERRSGRSILISTGYALACLVPTAVLTGRYGLAGAATGWLTGNIVAAAIAYAAEGRAVWGSRDAPLLPDPLAGGGEADLRDSLLVGPTPAGREA